ncbi:MAG: hypothetical protein ACI3V5_02445 [Faecousia sp.]
MDSFFTIQIAARGTLSGDTLAVEPTLAQFHQNVNEIFGFNHNCNLCCQIGAANLQRDVYGTVSKMVFNHRQVPMSMLEGTRDLWFYYTIWRNRGPYLDWVTIDFSPGNDKIKNKAKALFSEFERSAFCIFGGMAYGRAYPAQ